VGRTKARIRNPLSPLSGTSTARKTTEIRFPSRGGQRDDKEWRRAVKPPGRWAIRCGGLLDEGCCEEERRRLTRKSIAHRSAWPGCWTKLGSRGRWLWSIESCDRQVPENCGEVCGDRSKNLEGPGKRDGTGEALDRGPCFGRVGGGGTTRVRGENGGVEWDGGKSNVNGGQVGFPSGAEEN
jgi:hypothetical protein